MEVVSFYSLLCSCKHRNQVALYLFPVLYLAWTISFFAYIIYKALDNESKLNSIPTFKDDPIEQ